MYSFRHLRNTVYICACFSLIILLLPALGEELITKWEQVPRLGLESIFSGKAVHGAAFCRYG